MKIISILMMFCLWLVASCAQAASFDCTKASSTVEKLICESNQLSILDDQLARLYKGLLEIKHDKAAFQSEQIQWLKNTRNICKNEDCLVIEYQKRIEDLWLDKYGKPKNKNRIYGFDEQPRTKPTSWPLKFNLVYGNSYPICQPYVDMLNKAQYRQYPACERKILPEFKRFSNVQWTEITDKQLMDSILKQAYDIKRAMNMKTASKESRERYKNYNKNADGARNAITKQIQSGEIGLSMAKFDFDKDGDPEILYRETFFGGVSDGCVFQNEFNVSDKKITEENAESFWPGPYRAMSFDGQNDLFYFESDQLFVSEWYKNRGDSTYNIYIYVAKKVGGGTARPVCGINFQ